MCQCADHHEICFVIMPPVIRVSRLPARIWVESKVESGGLDFAVKLKRDLKFGYNFDSASQRIKKSQICW